MEHAISQMVLDFERGRLSRRALIAHLTGLAAAAAYGPGAFAGQEAPAAPVSPERVAPTFQAVDLNHVALTVRDVQRSQAWYEQHLGLKPTGEEGFLTTGRGWLALFKGETPGLNHYCYSIDSYQPDAAVETLTAAGLTPKRRGDRVYFDDPDGIECQLAGVNTPPA